MEGVRIHALEGAMLSSPEGFAKLLKVHASSQEESQVYVISPIHEGPLSFQELLDSAKRKDEIL